MKFIYQFHIIYSSCQQTLPRLRKWIPSTWWCSSHRTRPNTHTHHKVEFIASPPLRNDKVTCFPWTHVWWDGQNFTRVLLMVSFSLLILIISVAFVNFSRNVKYITFIKWWKYFLCHFKGRTSKSCGSSYWFYNEPFSENNECDLQLTGKSENYVLIKLHETVIS